MGELVGPLEGAFGHSERFIKPLLIVGLLRICGPVGSNRFRQKFAKGLDEVHPFSDTFGVDGVLRNSQRMLSPNMVEVGLKNTTRIWGFVSKFVMLDRFAKTLFGTDFHSGLPVPRRRCKEYFLGTGAKVSRCFFLFC